MKDYDDPKSLLVGKIPAYTNNTPLYNTTFFVTYYDIVNNKVVGTQKLNERWGFKTPTSKIGFNIPKNYTDQQFDYNTINQTNDSQGLLGVAKIKAKHNQIFVTYNVTPKLGQINIIYIDQLENTISSNTYYEPIGTKFKENDYLPKDKNLVVSVLYPQFAITQYSDQVQTLVVQYYVQPVDSIIYVKFITQDNQYINGIYKIHGKSGDRFDPNNYIGITLTGYKYVNYYNPDNITVFPRDPHSPNTIYFIVAPVKNNADKIEVILKDQNYHEIGSYDVYGNPYTDFNIFQCIDLPSGYELMNVETNGVAEFLPQTQKVYLIVQSTAQPSPVNPVNPTPPSPGSAYVVLIDEQNDSSLNPATYYHTQTLHEEASPQPVDDPRIVYRSANEIQVPDLNNISLSDIDDTALGISSQFSTSVGSLNSHTVMSGPQLYWQPYQYNLEYPNMYDYQIDGSKQPTYETIENIPIIAIYCYPAFVRGITFQLVTLNRFGIPKNDHMNLPGNNYQYFPQGWSTDIDPITNRLTYTVPYDGTTTVDYFLHTLFGGANGQFQDSDGRTWQATSDRKITFTQPYSYVINIQQLS